MPVIVDITLSDLEQEGTESVVERWLRQPGEQISQHEPLLEINTDKAIVEVPAPAGGVLREVLKAAGETVLPGDILGRIVTGSDSPAPAAPKQTSAPVREASVAAVAASQELSPAVRRLVRERSVDIAQVKGTGRGGRITYEDVQNYLSRPPATTLSSPQLAKSRMVPHSATRRRIAQHMVESMLKTAPHVTAVFEADLSRIVAHKQKHQAEFEQKGGRLTYTTYFVAAAVRAIQAVPEVNSRWHDDALEIFSDCNIGIATAAQAGLIVPVLHQAQSLSLEQIAGRLGELTAKARAGKLTPEELRHGTFTITNHGVSGSLIATPIIHQPQSAILGIGKMEKRLMVVEEDANESLQIKPMAYVTLTIDHRALDGFQANAFLSKFVEALSSW